MESTSSRKKRPRRTSDSDGDRRRGRPRVEKQDESAADRRRTQIRMAQRAYRQRKESTLEDLRKRVSELTNTIELMNKSFSDCRDRLYATNISQAQMEDLGDVASQFETFVQDARNPSEEDVAPLLKASEPPPPTFSIPATQSMMSDEVKNVPSWLDQSVVTNFAKRQKIDTPDIGLGYQMYIPETDEIVPQTDYNTFDTAPNQGFEMQKNEQMSRPILLNAPAEVPDDFFFPTAQMESPRTYSFQESTFARRIFRASIEGAYQLLLDPLRKPGKFERIFKLSLMGRDRAKLAAAFKTVLDKGPHEELDFWQAPLIHVGGAGTHYARRDPYGNLQPRKQSHNLGIVGPQTLALLDNAARDNLSTDMTVEVAGFEGEWFDPYDVQGYLEEKGIFIDPAASFAEAEILEWSPTPSNTSSGSSGVQPKTPIDDFGNGARPSTIAAEELANLDDVKVDFNQWNDFTDIELGAVGFSDAQMGAWMNFLQPGESVKQSNNSAPLGESVFWKDPSVDVVHNQSEDVLSSAKLSPPAQNLLHRKPVIIDVAKFVDVLIVSGVCLGRSPGFRRRDVDRALKISAFDAF